jgi:hypothetical protein
MLLKMTELKNEMCYEKRPAALPRTAVDFIRWGGPVGMISQECLAAEDLGGYHFKWAR